MKLFIGASALLAGIIFLNASPAEVSANAFNPENKIYVYGKVVDSRQITLDQTGRIILITSNTSIDVEPLVYVGSVSRETQVPLTPEVLSQYRELLPDGEVGAGILYEYDAPDISPETVPETNDPQGPVSGLGRMIGELAVLSNTIGLRRF